MIGTDTDRVVARKLNRTQSSVRHKRMRLGIPAFRRNTWTEAQERLLGTDTDSAIARKLGRSWNSVSNKRDRLGIPRVGVSRTRTR